MEPIVERALDLMSKNSKLGQLKELEVLNKSKNELKSAPLRTVKIFLSLFSSKSNLVLLFHLT